VEVMAHLADGYRRRYHEREHPAEQLLLPGFVAAIPPQEPNLRAA
jgi:hypothetical protein